MAAACVSDMSIFDEPHGHWFAVHVWSGREQFCATHLRMRGYDVFLPSYCEHRRWSDRVKKVERALFAGYVFCRLCDDAVGKVVTTPGVIRIVGDGRRPLPIPHEDIETIGRIVAAGVAATPCSFVQVGQRVRIDRGPLRDVEGLVLRTKQGDRLIVSIPLLRRSVAVEIEAEWVSVRPEPSLAGAGVSAR